MLYLKDTEKWKQFTTHKVLVSSDFLLCYISKILKNESNSQLISKRAKRKICCVISQRYWKMKAIHNRFGSAIKIFNVVLYLKDTEKWKQFTTSWTDKKFRYALCYISKILKNESNSQRGIPPFKSLNRCVISQRYWKMKAIHNLFLTL